MAWKPTTSAEKDFCAMQPGQTFVLGQLTYEAKKQQEADARERSHKMLEQLEGRPPPTKAEEIQDSLNMMEFIQKISGTKPLGEHASMADWDDDTNVEKEMIAMMRYAEKKAEQKKYVSNKHNKNRIEPMLPTINPRNYFEPCKEVTINSSPNSSYSNSSRYDTADSHLSGSSNKSNIIISRSNNSHNQSGCLNKNRAESEMTEAVVKNKSVAKNHKRRPNQKERRSTIQHF